jgi:hypothetical protein
MDNFGADIDAGGRVLSKEELILQRERLGKCVTCGVKCYDKTFFKKVALTIPGKVLNGRCLHCHPQNPDEVEILEASCVAADTSDSNEAPPSVTSLSASTKTKKNKMTGKFTSVRLNIGRKFTKDQSASSSCSGSSGLGSSTFSDRSDSYLRRLTPRPSLMVGLQDAAQTVQQLEQLLIDESGNLSSSSNEDDDAECSAISISEKDALLALNEQDISYADIINIMTNNPQLLVMNEGLHALSLIHDPDGRILDKIVESGGFDVIINAMDVCAKDGMAQVNACKVIFIACMNGENEQLAIAKAGAMKSLQNAIKTFSDDPIVLEGCLLALSNLCVVEENIAYMLDGDLIEQVINTMNEHVDNGGLQEHGCAVLALLARNDEARKRISNGGGFDTIVISMVVNPDDVEVQGQALTAVRAFCEIDDESAVLLAKSGAIDAVLEAMKAYPDLHQMQEIGRDALRFLGINEENNRLVGENGAACEVVIKSMWSHSEDVAVQEEAIEALTVLSEHPNNIRVILEAGGIAAVLAAMQTHASVPDIQIKGCAMLSNLASDDDITKVKIVDEDVLHVVVMAMVLHSDNKEIQERAVILLRKLCIKENMQRMITANVSPVITVAAEILPSCIEETSYIVAQLENAD